MSTKKRDNPIRERFKAAVMLFKTLYGDYRRTILTLGLLGFLSGVMGSIGIATLVPLFSFIIGQDQANQDPISKLVSQVFSYIGVQPRIKTLLIFIVLVFFVRAVILWLFGYVRIRLISNYVYEIRLDLYRRTLFSSWPHLLKHRIGFLENVLMSDIDFSVGLLKRLAALALGLASSFMYTITAFTLSSYVTALTLAFSGIFLLCAKPLLKKSKLYGRQSEALKKDIAHAVNESIAGVKTLKIMGVEGAATNARASLFMKLKGIAIKSYFVSAVTSQPIQFFAVIFIAVVFSFFYSTQPHFNIATFAVIMYLINNIFAFANNLQGALHAINQSIPHAVRIVNFKNELLKYQEHDSGQTNFRFENDLVFRKVNFSYHNRKEVLENIDFRIKKGEIVGIVGSTGSGKTTIADLLLRLFRPTGGEILIDGVNISDVILAEWRRNIGYVSQDIFLINDSIENNIRFYDESMSNDDIVSAAKAANIYDFIQSLPEGFATVVGERGVLLSGGERQRIVLARILARKPRILLLDEATSALDNASEALIKNSIEALKGSVAVIFITHRLSAVMGFDTIIALENGRIVEEGSPQKLLADRNSYFSRQYHASRPI